jgi:nucleotide-binding universal stress UspA family protein
MSQHPTSVVAGIDFSSASSNVIKHAMNIAAHMGSSCVFVHVLPEEFFSWHKAQPEGVFENLRQQAEAKIQELIPDVPGAKESVIEVCKGKPVAELHNSVKSHGASLLVISANDLTKKHLGTVASRCVRSAPCDVLVIRDWQGAQFKRILVCVDYSPTSAKALERAANLALSYDAHLEIIHVMFPPTEDYWGKAQASSDMNTDSYITACRTRATEQMKKFLAACPVSLDQIDHSYEICESRFPSVAITHRAIDTNADLVVMGTHGMSGFASNFMGSNAERLINDCAVSVLAVRD